LLENQAEMAAIIALAEITDPSSQALSRHALANYFAAALLMPYDDFLADAEESRYDIERLGRRYGASFEQVCHRLSTLQKPGAAGVPFHLVRVDIAGNISLRFSASGIRIPRYGGLCPRWNVHGAFLTPGAIKRQFSEMPDGARFFSIAKAIDKSAGRFHEPRPSAGPRKLRGSETPALPSEFSALSY
jgi:predicted transcriptional regulator